MSGNLYVFNCSQTGYYLNLNGQPPPSQVAVQGVTAAGNWAPNQPMTGTTVVTYKIAPEQAQPSPGVLAGCPRNTLVLTPLQSGVNPSPPITINVPATVAPNLDAQLYLFWAGDQSAASYVLLSNGTGVISGNLSISS